ncbi:Nickel transporter UreH [hydrothermal vent metagenome]|uniref:Nickel transporter UreH n=1 Tax=hydrothermal vent metagenome TaxID=652676 RepID=A0A3B1BNT2_9ZZZZ
MGSLLLIGLFLGMRHAMEADHVAAVASLTSRNQSLAHTIKQGAVWGMGHTITLFLFGSVVIFMDTVIPADFAKGLEMAVGLMLVLLGADVLRRVIRDRIHFHSHQHENGHVHFHVHSHAGESPSQHDALSHTHQHPCGFPFRALMVGMMHGMAGSAAVIVLALGTVSSPLQGLLYILIFGVGSIFGMALLSVIISFPMRLSAARLTWAHNSLQVLVGMMTIGLGIFVLYENRAILPTGII